MKKNLSCVYFAYNRPDLIYKSLPILLKEKFDRIYIFVDGPKNNKDLNLIKQTIQNIEILTKNKKSVVKTYYKKNLGIKENFFRSLDYVFKREYKAVVVEDDCLVSNYFVNYCSKLLDIYESDKNIWSISGYNALDHKTQDFNRNFFFSKYFIVWGWATWSDRWFEFSKKPYFWKKWKHSDEFRIVFDSKYEFEYWLKIFNQVFANKIKTWSYFIQLHFFKNNKYSIIPCKNMVKNLGLNKDATNTKDYNVFLDKEIHPNNKMKNLSKIKKINNNKDFDELFFDIAHHGERLKADNFIKLSIYYFFNFRRIFFKYLNKIINFSF